jgi:hypothetical protein
MSSTRWPKPGTVVGRRGGTIPLAEIVATEGMLLRPGWQFGRRRF